jgi:translocation and assembly module TamB
MSEETNAPAPRPRRRLRRAFFWSAGALVALVALLGLAFGLVQLPAVQARLAAYAESALAGVPGFKLTLTGLAGFWPFSLRAERIALSDEQGVWFEARDLELRFSPQRLFYGQLAFPLIRLSRLEIARAPETGPADAAPAEPEAKKGGGLPFSLAALPRLRLGELAIPELVIGESLINEAMRLSVTLKAVSRSGVARLEAAIDRQDAPGATRLSATLSGPGPELDLHLTIDESHGGLWGEWFSLSPERGFKAELKGRGPLDAWPGRLTAEAVGLWDFAADLTLTVDEPLGAVARGRYRLAEDALPAAALDILGRDIPFTAVGSLAHFTDLTVTDSAFGFGVGPTEVRGTLKLDASLDTDARVLIHAQNPQTLVEGSGLTLSGVATLEGRITGPVDYPTAELEADVERAEIVGIVVRGVHVWASSYLPDLWEEDLPAMHIAGALTASALDLSVPGLPDIPVRASLKLGTAGFERWRLADIDLDSPLATGGGQLDVGLDASVAGAFTARLPDLSLLSPLAGPALTGLRGRAELEARLSGAAGGERQELSVSGRLLDLSGLPGGVEAMAPGPLSVSGRLAFVPAGLELHDLALAAAGFKAAGSGRLGPKARTFAAEARLDLDDTAPAATLAGVALSGPLSLSAKAAGGFGDFGGQLSANSPRLVVDQVALDKFTLTAALSGLPAAAQARFEAGAASSGRSLRASGELAFAPGTLRVKDGRLATEGLDLSADADIDLATGLAGGTLRARSKDLRPLGRTLGLALSGSGEAEAELAPEAGQSVSLRANLSDIEAEGSRIGRLELDARLADVRQAPAGRLSLEAERTVLGPLEVSRLKAGGSGSRGDWELNLESEGTLGEPFTLSAVAGLGVDAAGWRLALSRLDGLYGGRPLALESPARLSSDAGGVALDDFRLRLGDSRLSAEGRTAPGAVDWRAELTELPLEILTPWLGAPVHGAGHGRLALSGTPERPLAEASVRLTGLRIGGTGLSEAPPVNIEGTATVRDGQFSAEASLGGLGESPLAAMLRLPLDLSLRPLNLAVRPHEALAGRLEGTIRLADLSALPAMDNRSLKGLARLDLSAAGSLAEPDLAGTVTVESARFEDFATGLILSHMDLTLKADEDRLELISLSAEDGDKGHVTASGQVELAPDKGFPFSLEARLQKARLLRTGLATTVVDGVAGWKGTARASTVGGQLTLDPTEIEVPKRLPVEVTELNVTEINVAGEPGRVVRIKKPKQFMTAVELALDVKVPARFFVRGRGLEAEFAGAIEARGTAAAPVLRGSLHTVRGRYTFLDRTFTLTEGVITFTGETPPKPFLDVRAEAATADITATLRLTGPPDAFKLALDSVPSLPEDEILARLLFGRSTSTLNPIQALQLASALAELTGQDTGPDILGTVRKALGIDRLDIQGGDGQTGASLTVGKYVREDVYLGLDQNLQSGEQDVTVEVELTPNLSLESRAGTASGAGLGVNWKYDY